MKAAGVEFSFKCINPSLVLILSEIGRKGQQLSVEVKNLIISHYKRGLSEFKRSEIVNRPRTTVHFIIKKFKEGNSVGNKPRSSRPKKID